MSNVPGIKISVLDTENTKKPIKSGMFSVFSVFSTYAHAYTREIFATSRTHDFFPRVHTRNIENTENNPVIMRVSSVLGIENTKIKPRTKGPSMNEIVCRPAINKDSAEKAILEWLEKATPGQMYLMTEITRDVFDIDPDAKDVQRMSPFIGRVLASAGMTNKRMRGNHGNRHYWVK